MTNEGMLLKIGASRYVLRYVLYIAGVERGTAEKRLELKIYMGWTMAQYFEDRFTKIMSHILAYGPIYKSINLYI
jgi:hypothetical protein